jgi:hypothetical protein
LTKRAEIKLSHRSDTKNICSKIISKRNDSGLESDFSYYLTAWANSAIKLTVPLGAIFGSAGETKLNTRIKRKNTLKY